MLINNFFRINERVFYVLVNALLDYIGTANSELMKWRTTVFFIRTLVRFDPTLASGLRFRSQNRQPLHHGGTRDSVLFLFFVIVYQTLIIKHTWLSTLCVSPFNFTADCLYGDKSDWCRTGIPDKSKSYMCYFGNNADICCNTCTMLRNNSASGTPHII